MIIITIIMLNCSMHCSGIARGASGGFAVILNVFLSRNLDQSMLKMRIFWEKTVKFVWAPPPDFHVVTSTYYYNFVEFISSAKCILFHSKKEASNCCKCSAFASSTLLHLFFTSNSVSLVEGERKNISCPKAQGTLATPLMHCLKKL